MTSVLPEPPRTPKAAATRELLLDLAGRMFIDRGYEAVSLRDIAVEAGVTKGAIYGHFRSKGQLLVEVIRTELASRDAKLDLETAGNDQTSLFDLFIHPGSRELRMLQIDAAAAARHDPDVAAGMDEIHETRSAWIRESLTGVGDPETMAFVINALSAGVGVQEAHERDVPDAEAWRRTVGRMFASTFRSERR
jgi:AcrR family transcriptional regulator